MIFNLIKAVLCKHFTHKFNILLWFAWKMSHIHVNIDLNFSFWSLSPIFTWFFCVCKFYCFLCCMSVVFWTFKSASSPGAGAGTSLQQTCTQTCIFSLFHINVTLLQSLLLKYITRNAKNADGAMRRENNEKKVALKICKPTRGKAEGGKLGEGVKKNH